MKETEIKLVLSLPISINIAYTWYPKRRKSDEYKDWEYLAWVEIAQQKKYSIRWDKWLIVVYQYYMPLFYKNWKKKVQDVANYEKCLSDFLSKHIDWFKDHLIKKIFLEKIDSKDNKVYITIKETN